MALPNPLLAEARAPAPWPRLQVGAAHHGGRRVFGSGSQAGGLPGPEATAGGPEVAGVPGHYAGAAGGTQGVSQEVERLGPRHTPPGGWPPYCGDLRRVLFDAHNLKR